METGALLEQQDAERAALETEHVCSARGADNLATLRHFSACHRERHTQKMTSSTRRSAGRSATVQVRRRITEVAATAGTPQQLSPCWRPAPQELATGGQTGGWEA